MMASEFAGTRYSNQLKVVIRDDSPMIHCGDGPSYRSVCIELTPDQMQLIQLRPNEDISRYFIEPIILKATGAQS